MDGRSWRVRAVCCGDDRSLDCVQGDTPRALTVLALLMDRESSGAWSVGEVAQARGSEVVRRMRLWGCTWLAWYIAGTSSCACRVRLCGGGRGPGLLG